MQTRNYMSIEFQTNYSIPKLTIKPLNRYFFPQKTFSNGYNNNFNNILNLKTSFRNIFLKPINNKYNTQFLSFKDKNSNISKRNTYYKTNNFSPETTLSVVSSMKSIKEKNKLKKINKNNSPLSFKTIELEDVNNSINKRQNNIKYIFIGNKAPPKNIKQKKNKDIDEIKEKNRIKQNIEISGQNLINNQNNKQNKSKYINTDILNKNNANIKIDFIPSLNSKSEKNIINNTKIKSIKKEKECFKIKEISVKPLEEYDEKNSEYNYDNKISTIKNNYLLLRTKSNKKLIVQLKTRKNTEQKDLDIKIIEDRKINNNPVKNIDIKSKNKIKYDLKSDLDMFDPVSLKLNKNLTKDFLRKKQKEKIFLEKLLENDKIKELISKFENNSEEKSNINEDSKINLDEKEKTQYKIKSKSFGKKRNKIIRNLKNYSLNKFNALFKEFFNRKFFKPSEYINYIADKIYEDINSFRNKTYNDKNEEIIDDNFSDYMNALTRKDTNNESFSIINLFKKNSKNLGKMHVFHSQTRMNIKEEKHLKKINYNKNINNENENTKKNFDDHLFETKAIQTQKNMNEINANEKVNVSNRNNGNKFINSNEVIEKKSKNKKERSSFKEKKLEKRKNIKNKIREIKDYENFEQINNVIENEKEKKSDDGDEKEKDEVIKELEKEKIDTNYSNSRFKKQKSNTLIKRNDKFRFSHFQKNKNFLEKEEENKEIKPEIENIEQLDLLDKLYDFKKFQIDELLILDEFDKITIEEDLKIKLKENMKQIISLIKKDHKIKDDYVKLFLCKKRIKHIIKKLSENDTKKNLITKSFKDSSFPENIEERKQLYRLMRTIENKIREELDKVDNYEYKESSTSSEKDNNSNYENIYEILPIEDEEEKEVKRKKALINSKEKQKKDLIYDNLYLFANDEEDEQNIELKQEVIDILNTNKAEESFENKKKSEENFTPPKSPSYMIKRRKFRKTKKGTTILRKLINKEDINEKENNKISLDNRINNFFEQIQKLKKENVNDFDYDKILKELMIKQGENYIEENIMREIRLLNFFRFFQAKRKMDLVGKKNYRNKYTFNSPLNFRKSEK